MSEQFVRVGDLEFCTQAFGDPDHPALILIMGAQASMLWWPEPFCERLAAQGFRVIRYDNRDVGRSTSYGMGAAPYALADLTADIGRIMDGYGLETAHLLGFSMGGYLAQALAIAEPARVASLAIWAAGPLDEVPGLPGMDPELLDFLMSAFSEDWTDEAAVVRFHVEGARRMRGDRHPFDEAAQTELARAEFHRARDRASALNHAGYDTSHPGGAAGIAAPTLIIHGERDPVTPVDHAHALAEIIPDSRKLILEGVGHELPAGVWDAVIEAVAANARRA